mgnify:CR=1 FL=1
MMVVFLQEVERVEYMVVVALGWRRVEVVYGWRMRVCSSVWGFSWMDGENVVFLQMCVVGNESSMKVLVGE